MNGENPLQRYLEPVRRRWPIVVAALGVGIGLAWLALPSPPEVSDPPEDVAERGVDYRATSVLIRGRTTPTTEDLDLVAMIARQDAIVSAVEERLDDRLEVGAAALVEIEADDSLGTLSITGLQPTATTARDLVTTYADEVTRHFDDRAQTNQQEQIERARDRLQSTDERIGELVAEQRDLGEGTLDWRLAEAELSVLVDQYGMIQGELRELSSTEASGATFEVIHDPEPVMVASDGLAALDMPTNNALRIALAALVAAALGLAVVFGLDRVDTRVRTREEAEEAFGLPVSAQLPPQTREYRQGRALVVESEPASEAAESFRSLRLSIQLAPRWRLDRSAPTSNGSMGTAEAVSDGGEPTTILVTSPSTGEGKSTVAANLAVSMAELGRHVLVVDCDFRRSTVGELLGLEPGPGLRDLAELQPNSLGSLIQPSRFPHVSVLRSGSPGLAPPWLTPHGAELVRQARAHAEMVVFDTGPLLVTNEAASLAPSIDALLLVARSGKTSWQLAKQSTEQLTRLRAMVAGVVLVGTSSTGGYGYHQSIRRILHREEARS